jgi:toxin ParE1/3/4
VSGVSWNPAALDDIERALEFSRERWPNQSKQLGAYLVNVAERLCQFPHSGREGEGSARELVLTNYPITVIYEPGTNGVTILRVVHQRQQWPAD